MNGLTRLQVATARLAIRRESAEALLAGLRADLGDAIPAAGSVGVAGYPEHGASFEMLAKNADRALYASKLQGRNRVTVFSEDA